MGPVALMVFKTSEPANNGLVGSTPTRLRHALANRVKMRHNTVFLCSYTLSTNHAGVRLNTPIYDLECTLKLRHKSDRDNRCYR